MNKASIRNKTMKQMKEIYYPEDRDYIDWMGYEINEINYPTYHHIVKREDLKKENKETNSILENGAYLGNESHKMLHDIEKIDKDLYYSWNHLFLVINKMKCYPIDDVLKMIDNLKKLSEDVISNYNNKIL